MGRFRVFAIAVVVVVAVGCAEKQNAINHGSGVQSDNASIKDNGEKASVSEITKPSGPMSRGEAERYILDLINRDRTAAGLSRVAWDSVAAKAGNGHARDMAKGGFTAHWGSDGSVPEQRYTEAGGADFSEENVGCFADAQARDLDEDPRFEASELERVESRFINEKPPHDGHRRNILTSWHTHVGVGLAKAKGVPIVCMSQEFVDRYGEYERLKLSAKKIHVAGEVHSPASFVGVGLAKLSAQQSRSASFLLTTSSYAIPSPSSTYFPKGFVTPIPISVVGSKFSIDLPVENDKGTYEISIWGRVPGTKDNVMLSLRTVKVQ